MTARLEAMKTRFDVTEMTADDIPAVVALAERIWQAHYPGIISDDQIRYMLDLWYSRKALQEKLDKNAGPFLLAWEGETLIGFLSCSVGEEEAFIHRWYVDTQAHSRGIGSLLLHMLEMRLPDAIRRIRLHVNRKNWQSVNFYFRREFVITGIQDTPIGDGYVMEDYVMVKACSTDE